MAELHGAQFRARVRLSTKDDTTLALAGETCERVPVSSLPGLLASRKIEPLPIVIETTRVNDETRVFMDALGHQIGGE